MTRHSKASPGTEPALLVYEFGQSAGNHGWRACCCYSKVKAPHLITIRTKVICEFSKNVRHMVQVQYFINMHAHAEVYPRTRAHRRGHVYAGQWLGQWADG